MLLRICALYPCDNVNVKSNHFTGFKLHENQYTHGRNVIDKHLMPTQWQQNTIHFPYIVKNEAARLRSEAIGENWNVHYNACITYMTLKVHELPAPAMKPNFIHDLLVTSW